MNAINVWANFGLRASPFFNQPLEPDPDHPTRPITLFVGRKQESRLVLNRVRGSHSSVTLVTGGYGVGKTTFLHYLRYHLGQDPHVFVPSSPVRVMSTTTAEALSGEVLRRLLAGVRNLKDADRIKSTRAYAEAEEAVSRVDKWSGSFSILGVGGGVGKATVTPPHPVHDIVSLAYDLAAETLRGDDARKTIIHLDNLENVYDPSRAEQGWLLFRDVRDLFQVDGVHILMSGAIDFYRAVIHREQKVADVVGPPVILSALEKGMAWTALEKRVEHLARNDREPQVPITEEAFEALYEVYSGNLRGMFTLAELSLEGRPPRTIEPVGWEDLVPSAREIALDQLNSLVRNTDLEYLHTAFKNFGAGEFRQADLAKHLQVRQPTVSRVMDRLAGIRLLEVVREEPPSKYVRLGGLVLVAFGWTPD